MTNEPLALFTEDAAGRFHAADPWTSKAAARSARPRAGSARYRILEALDRPLDFGLTAFELGARLDLLAHVAGTRLGELELEQLVERTGDRRTTDTGRTAAAYRITTAGKAALEAARPQMAARMADAPVAAGTRPPGRPSGPRRMSRRGLTKPIDRVLELIVDATANPVTSGLTDAEAATAAGLLRNAAGTYRLELERAGLVERTDRHRKTDRGQAATVHRATAAGIRKLLELAALVDV